MFAGDMAEYRAIRNALPGDHVRINSTKSMIGHLLGAAGAVEAVAVVQAMQSGVLSYYSLFCTSGPCASVHRFGYWLPQEFALCVCVIGTS